MLGYTHGDIKLQNICFDETTGTYSLIDFGLIEKIYHKNGRLKNQETLNQIYGNALFASDVMIKELSIGRKDDIESLFYLLCYLSSGILPVLEYVK